jgi:signal transduction histidine kinase
LALVKRIVEQLSLEIEVEASHGRGATFTIVFNG